MDVVPSFGEKVTWLFFFITFYWIYCIFWGIRDAARAHTADDYFLGGRQIPFWIFMLAATATTMSGWAFVAEAGASYTDGLPYTLTFLNAVATPFAGALFLKRQWILGRRFGFVTPGEMLAYYFRSDLIRVLVVIVAVVYTVPYIGLQLRAAGFLFHILTDNLFGVEFGMWTLGLVLVSYVATGGLRTVAYVDALQAVLLTVGIVILSVVVLYWVGGWEPLMEGIAVLSQTDDQKTPDGYSHYVAIPGVIQFVSAGVRAEGGPWTGVMLLTTMLAMMGIMTAPAFSMWAFASRTPRPFAPTQVWALSFVFGFILIVFTTVQGLGSHLLGADQALVQNHPDLVNPVMAEGLGYRDLMTVPGKEDALVPQLIDLIGDIAPWLVGFLAVCALAAMESTASGYMATTGGILARDVFKCFLMPNAEDHVQKFVGRMCTVVIVVLALGVATTATDALVLIGNLAISYGFQMCPALIAACFWPFLTRQGVAAGLLVGLTAVTLTEAIGPQWLGIEAWGRWPLTIHSGGWGILCNLSIAMLVSLVTRDDKNRKEEFHGLLREHASLPPKKRWLIPLAWAVPFLWFALGLGPGAVIGNTVFGDPDAPESWWLGMPSLWTWALLWWALGVGMMWFLAYFMEMGTGIKTEITPLAAERKVLPHIRLKRSAWRSPRLR